MKLKFTLLLTLCCLSLTTFATNYYISRAGDDNNDGTSPSTAWRNIGKINLEMGRFQPGDKILFRRGDNFGGSIEWDRSGTASNPITIGAYGNGAKPVITGAITVNGWQNQGGNVWRSGCRVCPDEVSGFFLNGNVQPLGRYPNPEAADGGYLFYEDANGNTQLTDNDLNTNVDWRGAEVVVRSRRNRLDRAEIQNVSGKTLTFTDIGIDIPDDYGYFIQNHRETLDRNGEWYWDADRSSFYLYLEGSDPNDFLAATTWYERLLQFYNEDHIIVEDLVFYGAKNELLRVGDGENIIIRNCEFQNSGRTAVYIYRTDVQFENNKIEWANNEGLYCSDCDDGLIRNNDIRNIGMIAGMGNSGWGGYEALNVSGNNLRVELNTIENVGYMGIDFWNNNVTIFKNVVSNTLLVKDGAGAIHNYDSQNNKNGRRILNNIILNVVGAPQGTSRPDLRYADGIRLSNQASGVEVRGNTVAYAAGNGIQAQGSRRTIIENNKFYGNQQQIYINDDRGDGKWINDISIRNNVFFSTTKDSRVATFRTGRANINSIGTINNNKYARPLNPDALIERIQRPDGNWRYNNYNVDLWNDNTSHDANSSQSAVKIPAFTVTDYRSNNRIVNPNFDNDLQNWEKWGPNGSNNYNHNRVTGQLNGGCVEYSFSNAAGDYMVGITDDFGQVQAGKKYLLEFSVKGNFKQAFRMELKKDASPWTQLASERPEFYHTTGRRNLQYLFECTTTESNPRLEIRMDKPSNTNNKVWFDNFKLREVEVEYTNPVEHFRLVHNPTNATKTIQLPAGNWKDVYNNSYSGSVTLNAFASKILITETASALPIDLVDLTANWQDEQGVMLHWTAENADNFSHFEVEKSINSFDFSPIATVKINTDTNDYQQLDNASTKRSEPVWYYRLKMVDLDGSFDYSDIVSVEVPTNNTTISVFPNPAREQIQIAGIENGQVEIIGMNGQIIKRLALQSTELNINDLLAGIYLLRVFDENGALQLVEKLVKK